MSPTVAPPVAPKKRPARTTAVKAPVVEARNVVPPAPNTAPPSRAVAPPRPGARTLTISQAADALGIDQRTLRLWADSGYAPHIRMPSGYRRFTPENIARIREKIEVPEGVAQREPLFEHPAGRLVFVPKDGGNGSANG